MTSWADMVKASKPNNKVVHGIGMSKPHGCPQWLLAALTYKTLPF